MREVTVFYGPNPHEDCQPVVLEIDDMGIIQTMGGFGIVYEQGNPGIHIDDPLPGQFPFCNVYRTFAEARGAAIAKYEQDAKYALDCRAALLCVTENHNAC